MTSASGATVTGLLLVTEEGKFMSVADDGATGCADVAQGTLALNGKTFSGSGDFGIIDYAGAIGVQINCAFTDGSVWGTSTLSGSVVPRTTLTMTGDDTTSLGTVIQRTTGTLNFDDVYNESSSLSKLAGDWLLSTGAMLSISSDGVISSQDQSNGCVITGQVSIINASYNAYSVSVTYSNCGATTSALNGVTGTGLMTLDDTVVPSVLYTGYALTFSDGEVLLLVTKATN
jgi:hypothetical protein